MNEGINALSLFDGMSCFQIALDRLNVDVGTYFASEIDKHAIKVAMENYPNTVQLGSVIELDTSTLPRINILCGGSPCQSFSFAGKRKGMATKCSEEVYTLERYLELKADGYEFEGQSYLFWEYMRVLTELQKVNPDILFLLENVEMGEKWERVLSKAIGVNGIHINSALVSAQSRKRIYWTNIGLRPSGLFGDLESSIPQPKDKGILLKDILEQEVDEKYFLSEKMLNYFRSRAANFNNGKVNIRKEEGKATCLTSSMASCDISDNFIKVDTRLRVAANQEKSNCFTAGGNSGGMHSDMDLILQPNGRQISPEADDVFGADYRMDEGLRVRKGGKSSSLLSGTPQSGTPKSGIVVGVSKNRDVIQVNPSLESGGKQPYQQNRVYDAEGISPGLMAQMSSGTHAILYENKIRRLTPTECERLQTVPDGYTAHVSDTQRYRMLGNGFTIDVIAYILSFANLPKKSA